MFKSSIETINELKIAIQLIPESCYSKPCKTLSGASIGQHTRHVIELYQALFQGYKKGEVCYDSRKRDEKIEQEKNVAIKIFNEIQNTLEKPNKALLVSYKVLDKIIDVESNYYREVLYNLEHLIHHQALIRIGIEAETSILLSESFGVAYSTMQHKNDLA